PLDTIQDIQNKPYVWIIRQNKIIKVNVQVLEQRYSDNIAVVQGLESSDQVSRVKFSEADLQKTVTLRAN
ncbi:hypothetical protein NL389_32615, partial [Klebsiella pneumoniae]|nr:hypothetical protein [Klebsiella pneumoniae]